ncbi:ankyrin repeat and death domain-containing protein 1A [Osmerus mordax]|uniref:ankyrin repeat and death domain-containing protein 1A n=1 Tax=Osmerus mordax TaxID=8014 RepID=UPI003510C219
MEKWARSDAVQAFRGYLQQKEPIKSGSSFDHKDMFLDHEKNFLEAAKRDDVETLKALGKVVNINTQNVDGRAALHYAVAGQHQTAVRYLLQRRPNIDLKDKYGLAVIHLAAWFGSLDILKLLVAGGAEQKVLNQEGWNIVHCAAINNHTDIVEYIVKDLQMKELDRRDQAGQRAFALAAEHGCDEMLTLLMDEEFNMATMRPNKNGDTPLHLAAKNGHLSTVQLLLQSFETRNQTNKAGETALSLAADNGHEDCVLALLEADCDPNITTATCSALHQISERGDESMIRVFLQNSNLMDVQDQYLQSPLHLAVKNSHTTVIYALLRAGANVNLTDQRSQTALHLAAELGRADIVEMLLKAGMDLAVQDRQGKTALGVAARADEVLIVDMIIKAERYFSWRTAISLTHSELNDESLHGQSPLTFLLDHRAETKHIRATAWRLAYRFLKPRGWKKLAVYWGFTKQQVEAIDHQWTGEQSYQEHGNRLLLIWLHGVEMAAKNPDKELYQSLTSTGYKTTADKMRMETESRWMSHCVPS